MYRNGDIQYYFIVVQLKARGETSGDCCCNCTVHQFFSTLVTSLSLTVRNKQCFTSKIKHRRHISLSASSCLSVLSLCPTTEPTRLLTSQLFFFLHIKTLSKPCVCVCDVNRIIRVMMVCMSVCVRIHTGTDTLGLFSPLVLVNRSRAAFMRWAHYHGDGRDGNAAAAAALVWQATVCCYKPHVSTSSSSSPRIHVYWFFTLQLWGCVSSFKKHPWFWFWSHLSPQQLSHTDEHTPQPLVDCQSRAGERLPSELNDDDLRKREKKHLRYVSCKE